MKAITRFFSHEGHKEDSKTTKPMLRNPLRKLRVLCASFVALATESVFGLTPAADNHGSYITSDGGDQLTYHWYGEVGWTYFIQSSNDLFNWDYVGLLEPGEDEAIEFGMTTNLAAPFFLRLKLSDVPTTNAWLADFDGDSFSNQDELDLGTDPLDFTDVDENGIPDDIDTLWASIPTAWKQAIADDTNADFYDPDNEIDNLSKVLPGQCLAPLKLGHF